MTDREKFLAALFTGPLLTADAIVVLAGEDAVERAKTAVELFRQGAAPVIIASGGRHEPPRHVSAEHIMPTLLGGGVAPDRLFFDHLSQHTGDQAVNVIALAKEKRWARLLLVASPYHLPRAVLTFVKAVARAGLTDKVRVVPVPTSHLAWWKMPPGTLTSRLDLLEVEFAKREQYAADVATWAEGLAYLEAWEGK